MKITVQRSGGFAAMTLLWSVEAVSPDDKQRWLPIVEACPWDEVVSQRQPRGEPGQPDRFTYSIRAGQRRATLPEHEVTGPWQQLIECAQAEGSESRGQIGGRL
ncbi:protealysin inhibitor emfourin [Arthrobacter sp. SIMBA_036]|uniref:protealysin inhibitor emfourin n=1 Tax=Arthrobacter sp. SIMBA_036 TaxID=3085778 RepID=UPI003979741D